MILKRKIYFDYNAATPVDKRVLNKMLPYFSNKFGNPSSSHLFGVETKKAIEQARYKISKVLKCLPEELIFTNGGTEAENLAIKGLAFSLKRYGNHVITSNIEHHAVECSFEYLSKHGFIVDKVGVNQDGIVNIDELKKLLNKNTILVSIMTANNETGAIQPIERISRLIRKKSQERIKKGLLPICFHTDSEAAFSYLNCQPKVLGVDALTINGSKIYGPKGSAVLYIKKGFPVATQICGGGQERFLRGGTENVPGIVGLAEAIVLISQERNHNIRHVLKLREFLKKEILKKIPYVSLNTPRSPNNCLPHILNVLFKDVDGHALVNLLSKYNIAISTGSACSQNTQELSATLKAMGLSDKEIRSSVRISLGKFNKLEDVKQFMKILPLVVLRLRNKK